MLANSVAILNFIVLTMLLFNLLFNVRVEFLWYIKWLILNCTIHKQETETPVLCCQLFSYNDLMFVISYYICDSRALRPLTSLVNRQFFVYLFSSNDRCTSNFNLNSNNVTMRCWSVSTIPLLRGKSHLRITNVECASNFPNLFHKRCYLIKFRVVTSRALLFGIWRVRCVSYQKASKQLTFYNNGDCSNISRCIAKKFG